MDEALYTANPVVSRREEADGTLLYNPDVDDVAVINGSGIAVFAFLAQPHTMDDIAGHLVSTYDGVDLEQAMVDVAAFVEQLSPTYIIEVNEDGERIAVADEPEQVEDAPAAGGDAPGGDAQAGTGGGAR